MWVLHSTFKAAGDLAQRKSIVLLKNDTINQIALLPLGKLPTELPSSMDAVRKQKEDVPFDSENPLYAFGYGLSY